MRRRTGGTGTTGPLDIGRLAEAFQKAGIDPRHWVSYGTVGIVKDDGTFDPTDPHAIYVQSTGCSVDVLLHPLNTPVTCRYSGQQGGASSSIYCPIRPGDEVLVGIPDGDMRMPPCILLVMNADHSRLPLGDDQKPIWQNDRVLVYSAGTRVQIRTNDGTNLEVRPDGTIEATQPGGATVRINGDGVQVLPGGGKVSLGDEAANLIDVQDGIVHGRGIDPFTGAPYFALGNTSQVVKAKQR
jgi:hypothetical protein